MVILQNGPRPRKSFVGPKVKNIRAVNILPHENLHSYKDAIHVVGVTFCPRNVAQELESRLWPILLPTDWGKS